MSAAHLEDIRKRYNFKELNIATWRNPSHSVLARGGASSSRTISATDAAKPYMPTYKYMISPPKPPEPTDDEESSSDDEDEQTHQEADREYIRNSLHSDLTIMLQRHQDQQLKPLPLLRR